MGRRKKTKLEIAPLQYSHPAECWVHSCESAARGMLDILRAMDEQQGPDWRDSPHRIHDATRHFARARYWAREGLKNPSAGADAKNRRSDRRSP